MPPHPNDSLHSLYKDGVHVYTYYLLWALYKDTIPWDLSVSMMPTLGSEVYKKQYLLWAIRMSRVFFRTSFLRCPIALRNTQSKILWSHICFSGRSEDSRQLCPGPLRSDALGLGFRVHMTYVYLGIKGGFPNSREQAPCNKDYSTWRSI